MKNAHRLFVSSACLLALAGVAQAEEYRVSGEILYADPGLAVIDQYALTSPLSIGREVHHESLGVRDFHAQANSLAERYGLHAHTYSQIIHQVSGESGGGQYSAHAFAMATYNDFRIDGPVGAPPVQTLLNFHLSGQRDLAWYHARFGSWPRASASVGFGVQIDGASGSGDGGTSVVSNTNGQKNAPFETGLLVGFDGDMDIRTRLFTLPVNTFIPITLTLDAVSSVQVDFADSFETSANADFGSTLRFATDRPVFDLPPGYTVNSTDAGIMNNVFMLAVPEPPAAGLLALGLACVGRFRRRLGSKEAAS